MLKNGKIIYILVSLFIIFAVISILYIFPSLKNKNEHIENRYIVENIVEEIPTNNSKKICNINKEDLEKKSKSLGLSYEIYEVKVPEKI